MLNEPESRQREHESRAEAPQPSGSPRALLAADPRTVLTTIYVALALGVAVLAIVFYAVGPVAEGSVSRPLFRWMWLAAAALCTIGAGIVRGRLSGVVADPRPALPAAIVVWSLAEAQALLAAIGFFITGDFPLLVAGLVLFIFLLGRHRPGSFLDRA
jgi:hypothetical protein